MNHYAVLGLMPGASDEDIKKAYRKLAQKHHPDKGGDEAKFKEIKQAYEFLTGPQKKSADAEGADFHTMEDIIREMKRAHARARGQGFEEGFRIIQEFVSEVSMLDAFKGYTMQVVIDGVKDEIKIPAGIPNGARGGYKTVGGRDAFVTVRFNSGPYKVKTIHDCVQLVDPSGKKFTGEIDSGLVEYVLDIDALDLLLGAWVDVVDFTGERCAMRVPAGHNPNFKLKLKNKGYVNWSIQKSEAAKVRADMYVKLNPVFKQPKDLDKTKVEALYKVVGFAPVAA